MMFQSRPLNASFAPRTQAPGAEAADSWVSALKSCKERHDAELEEVLSGQDDPNPFTTEPLPDPPTPDPHPAWMRRRRRDGPELAS